MNRQLLLSLTGLLVTVPVCAAVRLAAPFADGMVLQREKPVAVWGTASPGECVTVSFADQRVSATADAQGEWKLRLRPLAASKEGRTLTANGVTVKDVLVGEVWYCSGQSNMAFPLWGLNPHARDRQGATVAQMTRKPFIRFVRATRNAFSAKPRKTPRYTVRWLPFTPENLLSAESFSAVATYYGLELYAALEIPIGLIGSYQGGTGIDPWTPREGTASVPTLRDVLDFPVTDDWRPEMRKGVFSAGHQQPGVLFNEMVAPMCPYTMRGIIWYQGCYNAGEWQRYADKMHALYNGWTEKFEDPALKLYFVQLAPWWSPLVPKIQEAQERFAREEPNAAMAVVCDLGNVNDIHPHEKGTVGKRLALHALKRDYGFDGIEPDSPTLEAWKVEGDAFRLQFRHAKELYVYNPDFSRTNGFEIAGADGRFVPAEIANMVVFTNSAKVAEYRGQIRGPGLIVRAPGVSEPKHLRYLHSRPWHGNLYNGFCLPLGAFHIDAKE